MCRLPWVALLSSVAFVVTDAFVSPQGRWVPAPASSRQSKRGRAATPLATRTRFLTVRAAAEGDTGDSAPVASSDTDASESAASPKASPVPEDLDYYDGLLGKQPGYDKAVKEKKGQNGVTTEYPINLPSYLLLVLATVASIAFTGSIFEVTGSNPELGYTATYIIGTLSLPTFVFLFYAAIKKGQAEVEEDDAKFGSGRW